MVDQKQCESQSLKISNNALGRKDISKLCLHINGCLIPSSKQVKLLGVNIYSSLKFEAHIKNYTGKSIKRFMLFEDLNSF